MGNRDALPAPAEGHSVFSPSASAMWLACPGSLLPNLTSSDNAGIDAAIGTVAHGVAEQWLRTDVRPLTGLAPSGKIDGLTIEIDQEMIDAVERYVDWCNGVADGADQVIIESKVDFSPWTPLEGQTGTADHAVIWNTPGIGASAIFTDLKYGKGVKVFAERNPQLMMYALGLYNEWGWLYDIKRWTLRICQPRLGHFDSWEITTVDLLKFGEFVRERSTLALRLDAPRVAGEKQCRFCKVKARCAAVVDAMTQIVDDSFEDLTEMTSERAVALTQGIDARTTTTRLTPVRSLTTAQLERVVPYRKMVEGWFSSAWAELERRALDGEKLSGHKIVEGRSRRKWKDEQAAITMLLAAQVEPYTAKVITPAQAETQLAERRAKGVTKKDVLEALAVFTEKPPGKPTLAPIKDDRPDEDDAGELFEDVS